MDSDEVIDSEGERMVFRVRSRTNPKKRYRVDLVAMGGASQCECPDWNMVALKNITAGKEWGVYGTEDDRDPDRTCCYHTFRARQILLTGLLKRLAEEEEKP